MPDTPFTVTLDGSPPRLIISDSGHSIQVDLRQAEALREAILKRAGGDSMTEPTASNVSDLLAEVRRLRSEAFGLKEETLILHKENAELRNLLAGARGWQEEAKKEIVTLRARVAELEKQRGERSGYANLIVGKEPPP